MIAVWGLKFILPGLFMTIVLALLAAALDSQSLFISALVAGVLTIFLTFFYRNPNRNIPPDENLILAIADGRVLAVEDFQHPFSGPGKKVSIFLSVLDAHINRIPISGQIEYARYNPGKFIPAFRDKASLDNEQTEIGLVTPAGKIAFKQIAGILARRIEYKLKPGQAVKAGEIFGMIHFGSRAELFLPIQAEVLVRPGDKVKAGVSVIGRIIK